MEDRDEIITGRRDWDVVTFEDYNHDMTETRDNFLALQRRLMAEIRQLKQVVWAVVTAAGGKVRVPDNLLYIGERGEIEQIRRDEDMTVEFKATPPGA